MKTGGGREILICLEHVRKDYSGRCILAHVSLGIEKGEMVMFEGPSGIGKTTILEIISGFTRADAGRCSVAAGRIGYAPQDDCLVPWLDVKQNIELVRPRAPVSLELLEKLRLTHILSHLPANLSGGEKRRVNIARSLVGDPTLVILDEPFAFQDMEIGGELSTVLLQLREDGKTIVLAAHETPRALIPFLRRIALTECPLRLSA
jgi:ABC-type nitrate/sulfonate/bicarbonate transport system ATPase subunit